MNNEGILSFYIGIIAIKTIERSDFHNSSTVIRHSKRSNLSGQHRTIENSVFGASRFQAIADLVDFIAQWFYFIVEPCVRLRTDGDYNFFGFKEFFPVAMIDNNGAAVLYF